MENKDKSEVRYDDNREDSEPVKRSGGAVSDGSAEFSGGDGEKADAAVNDSEESSDERAAREAKEAAEQQREVDETEIIEYAESTVEYRRAVSAFDPSETRPQRAEFWEFHDEEYERDGYF